MTVQRHSATSARKKGHFGSKRFGYVMLLPALVMILLTQIYPFFYGIGMSFTNYNLLKPGATRFVGLANFTQAFGADRYFYPTMLFTLIYALSLVLFSYLFGLFTANLLNKNLRMRGIFRTIILLPWVISPMVMATNWMWLMNDQFGLINKTLINLGLIEKPILFLASKEMARFTVILVGTWKNIPFMTITLLAGMQGISSDLYEAARIDGASNTQSFFKITLPMIKPVAMVSTTLLFIWAFNGFENIFLLTEGGPANATMVLPIYAYTAAFVRSQMGYAASLSVIMLVIMMGLTLFYQWLNRSYSNQ